MPKSIVAAESKVPVYKTADVVVVGGGIAGISAALAAARLGQKVVLIEKSAALGGLATLGHVCIYLPLDDGVGNRVFGGLAEELLYTTIRYGYNSKPDCWQRGVSRLEAPAGRYQTHFNIPAAIFAFDELCEEENVETVFDVVFSEPVMEGNAVTGIICESKQGRIAFLAKQFVDASGDADLLYRAGAKTSSKDSICSHWAYELECSAMQKGIETHGDILHALRLRWLGAKPHDGDNVYPVPAFQGTTVDGVNGYLKTSRKLGLDYLKQNQRKDYAMITLPTIPQFRTSRHIVGSSTLTYPEDADRCRADSVGIVSCGLKACSPVFEYPYGGLIDETVSNVYAAGRIVACDEKMGWEMMRLIPACAFTGEAAGTAAALAASRNASAQTLDVQLLQHTLAQNGITLHLLPAMKGNLKKQSTVDPDWDMMEFVCMDSLAQKS